MTPASGYPFGVQSKVREDPAIADSELLARSIVVLSRL